MLGKLGEYLTELEIFPGPLLELELDSRCREKEGREGAVGGRREKGGWQGKGSKKM